MTLAEYLQKLVLDGTWAKLSSPAHSLFLFILAKSQGKFVKLSYSQIAKGTGISKGSIKKKIQELIEHELILLDEKGNGFKPKAEIDFESSNLPKPPGGGGGDSQEDEEEPGTGGSGESEPGEGENEQQPKPPVKPPDEIPWPGDDDNQGGSSLLDALLSILGSELGALLGGAMIAYLVYLWIEWVNSQENSSSSSFVSEDPGAICGLNSLNEQSGKVFSKPVNHLSPDEMVALLSRSSK